MRARLRCVWIGWLVFGAIQVSGQRAPTIMCGLTPETPVRTLRLEQALEEVGEPQLTCTLSDLTPGQPPPPVSFQVGLNVNITSRSIGSTGLTEAMLYTVGTTPANTEVCGGSEARMNDRWECPGANTWPGRRLGNNWLEISPVSFPTPTAEQTTSQQTFDLTGVRAAALQAEPDPGGRRLIRMELRGAIGMQPIQFNSYGGSIIVGEAKKSLQAKIIGFQWSGGALNPELLNVTGPVAASSIPAGRPTAEVEYRQLIPNAFLANENLDDDDAGSPVRRIDVYLGQVGQQGLGKIFSANQGTRLAVKFSNIPAGVKAFVPGRCEDLSGETVAELLDLPPGSEQNPLAGLFFLGAVFGLQTGETLAQWRIRTTRGQVANLVTCPIVFAFAAPDQPTRGFGFAGPSTYRIPGTEASLDLSGSYYLDEAAAEPGLPFDSVQPDREPYLFFQTPGPTVQWTFILPTGSRTPTIQQDAVYPPFDYYSYMYNLTQTGSTSLGVSGVEVDASNTRRPATVNWLTAEALGTQSPVPIAVSFNPAGLAPGVYDGAVRATRTGLAALAVPIVLTITPPGPSFSPWGFANAGSYANNVVAPGEAVVIFGKRFGPPSLARAELAADGKLSTRIGNTRVLFDGVAAPMIYAVDGQVSCLAPFALAGKPVTSVQVEYQGVLSPAIRLPVTPAVPALLTADASGFGQAAALNQDNSFNSVRGEAPGNFVSFFGVSGPNTTPGGVDGAITRAPFPRFPGTPTVWFDGIEAPAADVAYLGPAPELVSGVFQAVVRIPPTARPGSRIEVRIRFGKYITQPGVYSTVR